MCLAEGASFSTADTVPADNPTWAATAFKVTTCPLEPAVFFSWLMKFLVVRALAHPHLAPRGFHYIQRAWSHRRISYFSPELAVVDASVFRAMKSMGLILRVGLIAISL